MRSKLEKDGPTLSLEEKADKVIVSFRVNEHYEGAHTRTGETASLTASNQTSEVVD